MNKMSVLKRYCRKLRQKLMLVEEVTSVPSSMGKVAYFQYNRQFTFSQVSLSILDEIEEYVGNRRNFNKSGFIKFVEKTVKLFGFHEYMKAVPFTKNYQEEFAESLRGIYSAIIFFDRNFITKIMEI